MNYRIGDKVLFQDENQCEVRGTIHDMMDHLTHLTIIVRQEDGTLYYATVLKQQTQRN